VKARGGDEVLPARRSVHEGGSAGDFHGCVFSVVDWFYHLTISMSGSFHVY